MISNRDIKGAAVKKIDEFNASDRIGVKLLENNVHFLVGEIAEENIADCIKWITYENFDSKDKILTLYINSTGGDLYSAFALIDIMRNSNHSIRTVAVGAAMSAAFLIFASGHERHVGKNTALMCHQFSDSSEGKYHDIKATMKDNEASNQKMVDILREATGLTASVVKKKLLPASDVYLTAEEAVELKIADKIL